ncbi:molecular chaperone HtpG [Acetobacteraceae bacterium]|nr:molecular chaperone HtpG [Acetobacteraceae bacterium]
MSETDSKKTNHTSSEENKTVERHEFNAEVGRLLDLVVHSLYSEREIFLRELLANAADATDKRRFEAQSDASLALPAESPIIVKANEKEKTLTISDQGLGMSREELAQNLGTIARSGTKAFEEKLLKADNKERPNLIGQFGVGFYSAFMVADSVDVISKKAGSEEAWTWHSDGKGAYTLEATQKEHAGTEIILHIKEDAEEFLRPSRIHEIAEKWVSHLSWPVTLEEEKDGKPEFIPLNKGKALWSQPKSKVEEEEYNSFYHGLTHNFDKPAEILHWHAEGLTEFSALLFIPSERPFDFFSRQERESKIQLYVRRMFITDEAELLPAWLRFYAGVVDTSDLPLNVSREMLQSTPTLSRIRKAVTHKAFAALEKAAGKIKKEGEEKSDFEKIWANFGAVIKEGIWEDSEYRDKITSLSLFHSTENPEGWTNLSAYVGRMKEGQKNIYYITGEALEALRHSAHLEKFRARGIEVLLLSDPVDSFWPERLHEFDGKKLKSVTESDEDLKEIKAPELKGEAANLDALDIRLKELLGDQVKEIRSTDNLSESALILTTDGGPDAALQQLLRRTGQPVPVSQPSLELNPRHPLIAMLAKKAEKGEDLGHYPEILMNLGRLQDGEHLKDPTSFTKMISDLLAGESK